VFKMTSES